MELSARERTILDQLEMLIRQGRSETEAAATLKSSSPARTQLVDRVLDFRHAIAEQRRTIRKQQRALRS